MSTLITTNLKHASSSSNNLVLNSNGSVTGAGKILQVKSTVKTDVTSVSTASGFADIAGMSVTLTTPASGTKVLVRFNLQISGTYTFYGAIRLRRDSTEIAQGASVSSHLQTTIGASDMSLWGSHAPYKLWTASSEFLDTHGANGSTAVTYKTQYKSTSGTEAYVQRQVGGVNQNTATINLLEVAA